MEEQSISKRAVKIRLEDTVQKVIDIFELDDGKSFEEKKKEAIAYLENHEYAGFCGINNLTHDNWEIAVEILAKFRRRGIAYTAINIMLSEIKLRLGVEEFRVKIYPDNCASQYLFEKLGAVPYGIAEFMLHDENSLIRCEEENLDAIDDKMVNLAERFGVEPRKLLSHVLEYKLKW